MTSCQSFSISPAPALSGSRAGTFPQLAGLIATKQLFVIHAARPSGKTTLFKALARDLNSKGTHIALYCSLETGHCFISKGDRLSQQA